MVVVSIFKAAQLIRYGDGQRLYCGLAAILLAMVNVQVSMVAHLSESRRLDVSHLTQASALSYHGGPLLTSPSLTLHLLWYGTFPASQQAAITDFISSFADQLQQPDVDPAAAHLHSTSSSSSNIRPADPSVASWWINSLSLYTDSAHARASPVLKLGSMAFDPSCSKGKGLTRAQIASLLEHAISIGALPDQQQYINNMLYVVLTAADVLVESFCMSSCGYHSSTAGGRVPLVWVGNAQSQCLGLCAWPFAVPEYGPRGSRARVPPNGEAGATDGMIINLATLLAGVVTNPFGTGYFPDNYSDSSSAYTSTSSADASCADQSNNNVNNVDLQGAAGSAAPAGSVQAEAATACAGMFGDHSYPGFPGNLLVDTASGATYNALGSNGRRFLLPSIWNPASGRCQPPI